MAVKTNRAVTAIQGQHSVFDALAELEEEGSEPPANDCDGQMLD